MNNRFTYDQVGRVRHASFGRAHAESPAKHGDRDWEVWLDSRKRIVRPTMQEVAFVCGFIGLAQRKVFDEDLRGELYLAGFVDEALEADTPGDVRRAVERCDRVWEANRANVGLIYGELDWR